MSLDPYHVVESILVHAHRFSGSESMLLQRPPAYLGDTFYYPIYEIERDLAVAAFNIDGLHIEYQRITAELSIPPFTIELRREIAAFPKIIKARLQRWGWDYVLCPGGLSRIRERIEAHEKTKYYALLDAARSWSEGENITPHPGADRFANVAVRLLIKPTMTPDEGEKAFDPRYKEWRLASALGQAIPHVTLEEHGRLGQAIDRLAGLFAREHSPDELREYAELAQQGTESSKDRPSLGSRSDLKREENDMDRVTTNTSSNGPSPAKTVESGLITLNAAHKLTALSKGYISKLCGKGVILTNGVKGKGLLLSAASLAEFMELRDSKK